MFRTGWRKQIAFLAALTMTSATWASGGGGGGGGGSGPAIDPAMQSIKQAIDAQDWDGALGRLQDYVVAHPKDADAYNWLGYASRKKGNLDDAFRFYDTALMLNPKHRGAHEYLGEAYLQAGNLAKAQEHLAVLDGLCWLPCKEYSELKAALADYATHAAR